MTTTLIRPTKQPKCFLAPGTIYSGDNGERICVKCAGTSALTTGRDRSGMKVSAFTNPVILTASSLDWQNSATGSQREFWTLSTSEWNHTLAPCHKDEGVCSLSDILETGAVPLRFFLSALACRGILRRAEKRGKDLPLHLRLALEAVPPAAVGVHLRSDSNPTKGPTHE